MAASLPIVLVGFLLALPTQAVETAPTWTLIRNATVVTQQEGAEPLVHGEVLIDDRGKIACLGVASPSADAPTPLARQSCGPLAPPQTRILDLQGKGYVTPGFIETLGRLGQIEVDAEDASHDGVAGRQSNNGQVRAIDGISMNSRALRAAMRGGVTMAVVRPMGSALVAGQSVAFRTVGVTVDQAVVQSPVAVHVTIGEEAKRDEPLVGARSGQIAYLRTQLQQAARLARAQNARTAPKGPEADAVARLRDDAGLVSLVPIVTGELPLVAHVHRADDIAALLRLQKELRFRLVIAGGAEAHIVAAQLAAQQVPVLLGPVRTRPYDFATQRATEESARRLHAAGVALAIASAETHNARNLRWEAGFAVARGLPWPVALAAITIQPAKLLGLPRGTGTLQVGQTADLVVTDDDPLSLQGHVVAVFCGGQGDLAPQQD